MKKVFAGGALIALALFTFQPASADVLPVAATDTTITAPDVALPPADSPTVTTSAAPVVEPVATAEPVTVPVAAEPEPVATVAPVATVVEPVTAPVVTDTPTVAPVAEPVPTVAPTAPVAAPCMEDEPCWNCAEMGNHICGLNEAQALAAYPDSATFFNRYIATTTVYPVDITKRAVRSVINPAYQYVFNRTESEIQDACHNIPLGDADMNNVGICHASDMLHAQFPTEVPTAKPAK